MGSVFPGIPPQIATGLKDRYQLDTFVETGTFQGVTAAWAARNFKQVYTVEYDHLRYVNASNILHKFPNVHVTFGYSPEFLPLLPFYRNATRTLYWLDAHYIGDPDMPERLDCPLLLELEQLKDLPLSVIVIDDARLFLDEGIVKLSQGKWPSMKQIGAKLIEMGRQVTLVDDVIIAAPFVRPSLR